MFHWYHKHVIDHTLEPSSAVYKSWVVGETYCSFITLIDFIYHFIIQTDWLSLQILTVLSAFCHHSWASWFSLWPNVFWISPSHFQLALLLYRGAFLNAGFASPLMIIWASRPLIPLSKQFTILRQQIIQMTLWVSFGEKNISPHSSLRSWVWLRPEHHPES